MGRGNVDALNEAIYDSELGAQFYRHYLSAPNQSAECRLMAAVLLDAVELIEGPRSADPGRRKLQREAIEWVANRKDERLFSFNMIWTMLFGEDSLERARRVLLKKYAENS